MDLLLPGLASDTRRYQTPAQAKLQIDPADTAAEARATPDVTQEAKADDLQLDDKQSADLIKAEVDALPQVLPTKSVRFGSIKTDGKSVFQTVLEFRTNRPKSPRSPNAATSDEQPSHVEDADDSDSDDDLDDDLDDDDLDDGLDDDGLDGESANPANPSAAKPYTPNPVKRNFYASQRLPDVADANKLLADKDFVRVVSFDWGERYLYGASSMLVNVKEETYTMESNYVLSSGVFQAERIFQDWLTIDMPRLRTSTRPLHSRQQSMPIQPSQQAREPFGICAAMRTARHS
ncbi:hypothetical protein BC831DRAFT_11964 [Entophlyctis helioformis]|nr:hypothetical protein BC831DRAFT_11964 [Entophlyctis helioformis]